MIFNFGFNSIPMENVLIEIYIGNALQQRLEIPNIMAQQQFPQLCAQIANEKQPMRVKCIRKEYTNGIGEKEGRELTNSLSFENKAYINANIKNEYSDIKTNEIIER
jgi:hypothetical protein